MPRVSGCCSAAGSACRSGARRCGRRRRCCSCAPFSWRRRGCRHRCCSRWVHGFVLWVVSTALGQRLACRFWRCKQHQAERSTRVVSRKQADSQPPWKGDALATLQQRVGLAEKVHACSGRPRAACMSTSAPPNYPATSYAADCYLSDRSPSRYFSHFLSSFSVSPQSE